MNQFRSFLSRIALCASLALAGNAAHAGIPMDGVAVAQAMLDYLSAVHEGAARDAFQRLWESAADYGARDSGPLMWALDRSPSPPPPRWAPSVPNSHLPSNP